MKKLRHFVSIATIASLALVGCSQVDDFTANSDLTNNESNAISFGTYMGRAKETRAITGVSYESGAITTETLPAARFGVFAYSTGSTDYNPASSTTEPNFMYNQEIQYDGVLKWVYSPVKYWPNGVDAANGGANPSNTAGEKESGKLSFFAFAPYTAVTNTAYASGTDGTKPSAIGATTTNDDKVKKTGATKGVVAMTTNDWTGNVWVKYELGTSADEKDVVDLLWGTRGRLTYKETDGTDNTVATVGTGYNINLTKQTVDEKVKFLFKHALAKIGGATAQSTGETTTGDPAKCGFKVVVDVDKNNGDNQAAYFPSSFKPEETLVTIKEVKIQDGATAWADRSNNGIASGAAQIYSTINNYGWFNIETGVWCDEANTFGVKVANTGATYDVTINNDATLDNTVYRLNEKVLEIGAGKFGAGGVKELKDATGIEWSTAVPTGVTTTAQNLFANEDVPGLMVIPGGSADLYITVDYFVRTADPALREGFTSVEQVITNKVSLGSLDPNKYYTIIMHLGLTSVKFEAVVSDWQTKSDSSIDEDGKETGGTDENTYKETVWLPSNVVAYTRSADVAYSAASYAFDGSTLGLGDVVSGTTTGNITAVAKDGTTSTQANITLTPNHTTATVSTATTITYDLGTVTLTINQAPVAITATCDNCSISQGNAVTLTVTNTGTSSEIAGGSYTVGVYTDPGCTTPAAAANFTDTTGANGKVTFNTDGTYYIKVTSGESTIITSAITVSI